MARRLAIALTVLVTVLVSAVYVATGSVALRTGLSQATILGLPVVMTCIAVRAPRHLRVPLWLTALASVSYAVAEAVSASLTVDGAAPYPNAGETFIGLGALVNLVAFCLLLPRPLPIPGAVRLDVGIAATGVVLLFAQTGVLTSARAGAGGAPVAVAGPLLLVAVAYLTIAVLSISQPGRAASGTSMLVGAMAMVLADVAFLMETVGGLDEDGRLSDVGYVVTRGAFVVMALLLDQPAPGRYRDVERYRVGVAGVIALLTPLGAVIGSRTAPDSPEWLTFVALALPVVLLTWRAVLTVGRLSDEAGLDTLTGLHSRRSAMASLERLCEHGPDFVLLVCDLDGFKSVNDTLGHAAGDSVLVEVSAALVRSAPEGSTVARTGGDEFTVLVPRTVDADRVRDALTARLASDLSTMRMRGVHVGVSLGATTGGAGSDPHDLLVAADAAMYAVKQAGRSRAAGAPAPVPAPRA